VINTSYFETFTHHELGLILSH